MTEKLYDKDSHLKEFTGTVLSCENSGEKYAVILNQTAFFPEGGGQQSDRGYIGGAYISDVQIKNGEILHFADKSLSVGQAYDCKLDFDFRFRNMQNHSGEHIISGIVHRLYGFNNVGFHLGAEMTMDFDGELTRRQLDEIEDLANKAVYENLPVKAYYPTDEELKNLDYRSKLDLKENVRIVEIKGVDVCACCAPHVKATGEIGVIKILDFEKYKGGVRLIVKCGADALRDYREKYRNVLEISNLLSSKQFEVSAAVVRLNEQLSAEKAAAAALKKRLITEKAAGFAPDTDKTAVFENGLDIKELQLLADALCQKAGGICGAFSGADGAFSFAICGEETALGEFFTKFKAAFNTRGGGRNGIRQGTVCAERAEIEGLFKE